MKINYLSLERFRRSFILKRLTCLLSVTTTIFALSALADGPIYGPVRTPTNQVSFPPPGGAGSYLYDLSTNSPHWTTSSNSNTNPSTPMMGLVGKITITLNGANVTTDSFTPSTPSDDSPETNAIGVPILNKLHRSAEGQVQLSLNGLTNFYYTLETSSDLTNWIPVQTNSTLKDTGITAFQLSSTNAQTFYRAKGWGKRYHPLFQGALAVKEYIDPNGNNLTADSYDSQNPNYSSLVTNVNFGTNWCYDIDKRQDHGDIAATFGITNAVGIGNANIWGKLFTGPLGSVDIGWNGRIGDAAWQTSTNSGVQPGFVSNTMNTSFPEVLRPPSGGLPPIPGVYKGVSYTYLLGNYPPKFESNNRIGGKLCVTGTNVVLWARGGLNFSGNTDGIYLAPGASILIFVGNSSGTNVAAILTGKGGVNANGYARNCQIYGLPTCTSISTSGDSPFVGTIYAPNAVMYGSGGGNNELDSMGAIMVKSATLNGHWNFHYDEALNVDGPYYSDVVGYP